jgi:hypothetical protein
MSHSQWHRFYTSFGGKPKAAVRSPIGHAKLRPLAAPSGQFASTYHSENAWTDAEVPDLPEQTGDAQPGGQPHGELVELVEHVVTRVR